MLWTDMKKALTDWLQHPTPSHLPMTSILQSQRSSERSSVPLQLPVVIKRETLRFVSASAVDRHEVMYYTVCYLTGIFYAVVRQISMLFIDNKISVFCKSTRHPLDPCTPRVELSLSKTHNSKLKRDFPLNLMAWVLSVWFSGKSDKNA